MVLFALELSLLPALLARFSLESNAGKEGWECSVTKADAGIYIPGRSLSHADVGFGTTKLNCSQTCTSTPGCTFYMWGHSQPDFHNASVAWCYIMR